MRKMLFSTALLSAAFAFLSAGVLVRGAPLALDQLVGGVVIDGCKDCKMDTFVVYECLHWEEWDPCIPGGCGESTVYYQKCDPVKKKEEKSDCDVEAAVTIVVTQIAKKTTKPAPCGDVWQDFAPVPGAPKVAPPCVLGVPATAGKCFIAAKDCDGAKFFDAPSRKAIQIVCKGKAKLT